MVTPLACEAVFFWGTSTIPSFRNQIFYECQQMLPHDGRRTFELGALTWSLRPSSSLRSHLKHVDLRWSNQNEVWDDIIRPFLEVIEYKSTLLTPLPSSLIFEIPIKPAVTSLAFKAPWQRGCHAWMNFLTDFERLCLLMATPPLLHFRLGGWCDGGHELFVGRHDIIGSSNIEVLTSESAGTPQDSFQEILRWPKALKSLT